jgi:hypothetical protein
VAAAATAAVAATEATEATETAVTFPASARASAPCGVTRRITGVGIVFWSATGTCVAHRWCVHVII